MSKAAKRSANQAFEEEAAPGQKRDKKNKRSKRSRDGLDPQQSQIEAERRRTTVTISAVPDIATQESPPQILNAQEKSAQSIEKKKRKRKHGRIAERSSDTATTTAKSTKKMGNKMIERRKARKHVGPAEVGSTSLGESEQQERQKNHSLNKVRPEQRRKKHGGKPYPTDKAGMGEATIRPVTDEPDQPHTEEEPSPYSDGQSGSLDKKKKKKKERSRANRNTAEYGGGVDLSLNDDAEHRTLPIPLEDRIEAPAEDGSTGILDVQGETVERDSGSDDGQGAVLKGLVPLEHRIEAPKKKKSRQRKHTSNGPGWSLSPGTGGIFIDHEPVFTCDDEHMIIPTRSDARVYSRLTSLLVRTLQVRLEDEQDAIVSCIQSPSTPAHLLLGTSRGYIFLWDWTQGQQIQRWKSENALGQILPLHSESKIQRILAVHGNWDVTISILDFDMTSRHQLGTSDLLSRQGMKPKVLFFEETGVIIATTRKHLLLGYCPGFGMDEKPHSSFYWRELRVPPGIATFDARSVNEHRAGNTPRVDIAVGVESGEIILYEDLLFRLIGKEGKKPTVDISPRNLHWHRSAVNSVKWSADGNYLISGGSETVLVLWQLDTNRRQYLPHLTNEIMNISVSPDSSSYALRLSDNSVMVLSTANLDVTTNVSGFAATQHVDVPLAAALHPTSPDRLLISVPRNSSGRNLSAFSLQTYDLNTDRELGRQALTRNSTTVVATQSSSRSNLEPNVTCLQLSADGKWLATVEEWHADPQELDAVTLRSEDDVDEFGVETCVKIWLYNEQQSGWELVNRIDNPHSSGSTKVLALSSSPNRDEFASAGSDGKVRIWRPRSRVRDGVPVRNATGEQLYNWSQSAVIACTPSQAPTTDHKINAAALAYSPDGTVIAASWSQSSLLPRWTYLIDSEEAKICHSAPSLLSNGAASLVFSDRYLISLSDTICVYDTVTSRRISNITLEHPYRSQHRRPGHLAANIVDGTIAIAVNPESGKEPGRLVVINVHDLGRGSVFDQPIPAQTHALLASPSMQGYVLVDGNSTIRHVKRSGPKVAPSHSIPAAKESEDVRRGLDRIFGQAPAQPVPNAHDGASNLLAAGEDTTAGKTLEDVLSFSTTANAPSVGGLFERIAAMFTGRAVAV